MSKIIDKKFDTAKKISRTKFLGSPNLMTSPDLNRQIEALKYQLDYLDDKTGMLVTEGEIIHTVSGTTLNVSFRYLAESTGIYFKGCKFNPEVSPLSINFTSSAPKAYLCLVADTSEVTYADDFTHEIAGAKFEDGTAYPAANQIVYSNEALTLTHSLPDNLVGILAVFTLSDSGNVVVQKNFTSDVRTSGLFMGRKTVISDFNPNLSGKVANGKTYDEAFSIIENRFTNLVPEWTALEHSTDVTGSTNPVYFRIQNGMLYIRLAKMRVAKLVTKGGGVLFTIGTFPTDVRTKLKQFFNGLGLPIGDDLISAGYGKNPFIPYGEIGTFPVVRHYSSGATLPNPVFGMAKVSLILSCTGSPGDFTLDDVFLGGYVTGALVIGEAIGDNKVFGPTVDWLELDGAKVEIPQMFGVIPLFGPMQ